jgi:RNA polymerase subunit RPABC4/transcription elongation factor Spt4
MLIRIAAYENAIEAHLARGRLEAEGIPAYVCHEHHITANWLRSLALQGVKIYVHPMNRDRAREIIAAHDRGEYALEDDEEVLACPRCNSTNLSRHHVSWKSALLVANLTTIPLYFRWATMKCDTCRHE